MELLLSKYYFAPFLLLSFRFFSHSLNFFVSNLFPNSGLRKGSQGQRVKTPCHVAASGVCISSALLKSYTQMAFFFLSVLLCFSLYK